MFAVIVATYARRFKRDRRRCRCRTVKKNNRRASHASNRDGSYHFIVAVWRAKESESAAVKQRLHWQFNGAVSMEVLSSSCGKTRPDYGLKKDSHKRDLIARTPHLLSNAKECGAR